MVIRGIVNTLLYTVTEELAFILSKELTYELILRLFTILSCHAF